MKLSVMILRPRKIETCRPVTQLFECVHCQCVQNLFLLLIRVFSRKYMAIIWTIPWDGCEVCNVRLSVLLGSWYICTCHQDGSDFVTLQADASKWDAVIDTFPQGKWKLELMSP